MLLLLPFYLKDFFKSKTIVYFLIFYLIFLLKTEVADLFTHFYINGYLSVLKRPYAISFSRMIEMMACITFCIFIFNELKINNEPLSLIKKILFVQIFCFGIFYLLVFLFYKSHLLHTTAYDNPIVYDTTEGDMVYRLKGFYVEGGPLGLFYAFLATICIAFYRTLNLNKYYVIMSIALVFLASSKAGYMLLLLAFLVFLSSKISHFFKNRIAKIALYSVALAIIFSIGALVLSIYIDSITNVEQRAANFAPGELDPNFMLGRISASVIVPNMIKSNWIEGIGWGNYPLLRNAPQYRSFMPEVPVSLWDATGFGGLVDMLIEAGFVLFFIYLLLYYRVIRLIRRYFAKPGYIILSYLGPLLLGVPIYFFYTWFLLGIILFFIQREKPENTDVLNFISAYKVE